MKKAKARRRSSSPCGDITDDLAEGMSIDQGEDEYLAWLRQLAEELGEPSAEAYEWAKNALEA